MNREIKFRAWDKTEDKMYNDYTWVNGFGELCPKVFKHTSDYSPRLIIEQYTGLKDRNGKEIYEGDKYRYHYIQGKSRKEIEELGKIIFKDGCFMCYDFSTGETTHAAGSMTGWIEIIGNIHETPEILES